MKYRTKQQQKGCHATWPPLVLGQGRLCRRRVSNPRRPSEHYLDPKVHLLGGIVLQACLQHPLRLHPLDILHVPLAPRRCSCGWKGGTGRGKGLLIATREKPSFAKNFQLSLGFLCFFKNANLGLHTMGLSMGFCAPLNCIPELQQL